LSLDLQAVEKRPSSSNYSNLKSLFTESRFEGGIIWCYSEETAVPSKQLENLGLSHIKRGYLNRSATPGVNPR